MGLAYLPPHIPLGATAYSKTLSGHAAGRWGLREDRWELLDSSVLSPALTPRDQPTAAPIWHFQSQCPWGPHTLCDEPRGPVCSDLLGTG